MKKRILFFLFVLFILITSQNNCNISITGNATHNPFIGGTGGISINFEEDFPPDSILGGNQEFFDVVIRLENTGEWSVKKEDVIVSIQGASKNIFGKTINELKKNNIEKDLDRIQQKPAGVFIDGSPVYIEFLELSYPNRVIKDIITPLRATVCYKYGTISISNICISKDDSFSGEGNDLCITEEKKRVFNSAAPIIITEFNQISKEEDLITFSFKIKHRGSGDFYAPDSKCGESNISNLQDKIKIDVNSGLPNLVCLGEDSTGHILLHGGERTITCIQKISTNNNYENRINIQIKYDYLEDITKNILVRHTG